jgi:hypothetical protein
MLGEIDHREVLIDDRRPLVLRHFAHAQGEADVFFDRQPRQERGARVLEEHDAVLAGAANG